MSVITFSLCILKVSIGPYISSGGKKKKEEKETISPRSSSTFSFKIKGNNSLLLYAYTNLL